MEKTEKAICTPVATSARADEKPVVSASKVDLYKNDNRMSPKQIAHELECSVATIYQWSHYGRYKEELPLFKGRNGKLFALRRDVQKFKSIWLYGSKEATERAKR